MPFGVFWYGTSGVMYFTLGAIMVATFGLLMLGLPFVFTILTTWSFVLAIAGAIAYVVPDFPVAVTTIQLLIVSCMILTVAGYKVRELVSPLVLQVTVAYRGTRTSCAKRSIWLGQMAGFFRHEIKNSILGVQTALELLTRHTGDVSPLRPYVDRAKKGIQLIDSIARGVSNATSIESTFHGEKLVAVRLDSLVQDELEN